MSTRSRTVWFAVWSAVGVFAFAGWAGLKAADEKSDAKPPAAKEANAKDIGPQADPYEVPDSKDPKELLQYLNKVGQLQPPENASEEDLKVMRTKLFRTMNKVADRILATKPEGQMRAQAYAIKLASLGGLEDTNDDAKAGAEWRALAEKLKTDDQADVAKIAQQRIFMSRVQQLAEGKSNDGAEVWQEVKTKLAANPAQNISLALMVGHALEGDGKHVDLAVQAYKDIAEILAKSENPQLVAMAKKFDPGAVHRAGLIGKTLPIKGTLLDGHPFDPASVQGKVVLVDYWATWCGPCMAELPNVVKNYKKYHDKGFEVVGISLDDDKDAVEKLVKDKNIPWPILFSDDAATKAFENPMASELGIMSIPTVILLNQKGEVVSLNARGPELGKKLAELLGKVDDKPAGEKSGGDKASEKKAGKVSQK